MALPSFVASAVTSWAAFYDAHHVVSVTVRYLHLAGIVVGGGKALAADGQLLRAARAEPSERIAALAVVGRAHRVVVPALAIVVATGILLTAADSATFLASRLYWTKLAFVTLLLVNGLGLVAAESRAARGTGWSWLTGLSGASLVLWLLILHLGVWLTVAA
jgi:hypothetical protein